MIYNLSFLEPDFDYIEALAPYQPLQIKVAHCAIDTSLNFTQANKLIRDLKPKTLVVPECYTQPPVSAPNLTELVIGNHPDTNLISYKWGEVRTLFFYYNNLILQFIKYILKEI